MTYVPNDIELTTSEAAKLRNLCDDGRQYDEIAAEFRQMIDTRLSKIRDLADRWDAELQREFSVGSDYTDYHSRELRRVIECSD